MSEWNISTLKAFYFGLLFPVPTVPAESGKPLTLTKPIELTRSVYLI